MTWVNPWVLYALPIGLIPLLIYLLIRQRLPRIQWPTMEFVLLALKKNRKRILLQTWILLIIRTLILIILVLLIARPVTQGAWSLASGERNRSVTILIVDDSCSMAATDGVATSFERARNRVFQVLEELGEGSRVALILAADPPMAIIPQPTRDFGVLKEELEKREPRDGRANYGGAIEMAGLILEKETEPNREVILVTDGQATGWENDRDTIAEASENLGKLSHVARFILLTPPPQKNNVAVTLVEPEESFVSTLEPVNYRVLIRNFSETPVEDLPVELFVDGDRVARQTVQAVPPKGEEAVLFSYRSTRRGPQSVWGKCGEDTLDRDNTRYLAEKVYEQISTLIIEGRPDPDPFLTESGYLRHALAPQDPAQLDAIPLLNVQVVEVGRLSSVNLRDYAIIIVAGVDTLSPDSVNELREHAGKGGGLLILGSSEFDVRRFEETFASGDTPLVPVKLGELQDIPANQDPARLIIPEPIPRRLAAFENSLLRQHLANIGFRRFRGIAEVGGKSTLTLARYSTGEAALVEVPCGAGHVLFLSCGANRTGSDFPLNPAYVPFFQDLVYSLLRTTESTTQPGETLVWSDTGAGDMEIVYPDTTTEPAAPYYRENPSTGQREVHFTDSGRAGIYSLRPATGSGIVDMDSKSVNVPSEESDLRVASTHTLRDRIGSEWTLVTSEDSLRDALRAARFGSELWPLALLILSAFVLAENILARLFSPREIDAKSMLRRAQGV